MYQAYRMPHQSFRLSCLWRHAQRPATGCQRILKTTALALLLTASLSLTPAGWDERGRPQLVGAWAAASQVDDGVPDDDASELDDETGGEDDGSARLGVDPLPEEPPQWQSLSSDEEKALLGNWGDADDEDGD